MSYDDTNCPCGGHKLTQTMLCDDCIYALSHRREMHTFLSNAAWEQKRHAAIILVTLARGRKRRMANRALIDSESKG